MGHKYAIFKFLPWLVYNAANITYDVANHIQLFAEISGDGLLEALTLGLNNNGSANLSREDCIWRRGNDKDPCPDPDVHYYFYPPRDQRGKNNRESVKFETLSWVRESSHDPNKDTVILIHGYAGTSDILPMGVLRDAYLTNGSYNVYEVDWSPLSRVPCYASAVHNMRPVARCVGSFLTHLRNAGVDMRRTTCVGHSLGAHICGISANYLLFRVHKIIGIDPARPLIRSQLKGRLDPGDADVVQVIHTTSTFGDPRRSGHIDFCMNGARAQPFCANATNEVLCSHIRSVCYLAESLDGSRAQIGHPCVRRCLAGERRPSWERHGLPVPIGHSTPEWVDGMFCVTSGSGSPYCPTKENPIGNPLCCVPPKSSPLTTNLV
ncbi:Lipase [Nesidiocoris tenuis]|uniref:Lipase n=1 Tax=Nesidiocoris tenuis TaxID=355587 RepID=A0ABN7ARU4_9HEMI|nr:Lipase [Nesidiocoris tenuis]